MPAIAEMTQAEKTAKLERYMAKENRARAQDKAMTMRLVEGGTAGVGSIASGVISAWKPELDDMLGGLGVIDPAQLGLGVVMLFLTKGAVKEVGSGLMYAGGVPLLKKLGAKFYELASA